mmetsp:Transcript_16627/g.39881  ORF Transcript_16627/g.39881 Transcript_16627/m.39881 type:complete len:263 (-) Transcript_16627:461-1249(-)
MFIHGRFIIRTWVLIILALSGSSFLVVLLRLAPELFCSSCRRSRCVPSSTEALLRASSVNSLWARQLELIETSDSLRPPDHCYAGYGGPWIESFFYRHWLKSHCGDASVEDIFPADWANCNHSQRLSHELKRLYIPAAWTNIQQQGGCRGERHGLRQGNHKALALLQRMGDAKAYTVLQDANGISKFLRTNVSENIRVFDAGGSCKGVKDCVAIPLIKGELKPTSRFTPPFQQKQSETLTYKALLLGTSPLCCTTMVNVLLR